ncbi:lipid asymmetry maintenance protein MlaB [Xenorhabdus bharatensis]|uniref:lipid asymmetry maintenance protein MlaB n=1 Tax=Xenorhabdus bharatensis TaxID=3136256 RepID=UPI0030F3E057
MENGEMKNREMDKTSGKTPLSWKQAGNTLFLKGTLDRDSLLPLWQQKDSLLAHIENIDVSGLEHVDSTGMALFVRIKGDWQQSGKVVTFSGIGERLNTLIALYGLQSLFADNSPEKGNSPE